MEQKVTVIIPFYNAQSTVVQTIESLFAQSFLFNELVVINDASADDSLEKVKDFLTSKKNFINKNSINIVFIDHRKSRGLAYSYNDGIKQSKSQIVVTLHADIILKKNSLKKLIYPFLNKDSNSVVATSHCVIHPYEVWLKYNFWQKCFFSRLVYKKFYGLDGKFDGFSRQALFDVGLFDYKNFRTAGEDGDIIYKLKKIGSLVATKAEIVHIHQANKKFGFWDIAKKQAQYSEAQGTMMRRGITKDPKEIFKAFFREFLLLGLFIPYIQYLSLVFVVIYSFSYTWLVFKKEYKDPRIVILPLLNIYLLFISAVYSIKGLIYGKQKI